MSSQRVARRDRDAAVRDLDPISRDLTLGDRVHAQLAEFLVSGRFAPGDRLSLRSVAKSLGVSMMPVREAVTRLTADGALEVMPNRAVRVPPMSEERFEDLTRVRIEVEGFAAAEAALHRTQADLDLIRRAEADFRKEAQKAEPDPTRVIALNKDFHFAIYSAAQSLILMEIIQGLWLKAGPIINLDFRGSRERLEGGGVILRHRKALDEIEKGNPGPTRDAIVEDIQSAADFILAKTRASLGE